jgi:hypothetical protein
MEQQKNNDKLNKIGKEIYPYFTSNDIVGSLGELLFYNKLYRYFFDKVEINRQRKNKCDFFTLKNNKGYKIEVKSRYLVKGNPVLSHTIANNFNFLVFIHFKENYELDYWCILSSDEVKKYANNNRLKICSDLKPVFENRKYSSL